MVIGLGLDLMDTARMERALRNPRFAERVYSPEERERIARFGAETAAGIFAAKEAVAKALGTGFTGMGPWDIHIAWNALGAPYVRVTGGAEERMRALGGRSIRISITHCAGMAAAVAILTDEEEPV